MPLMASARITVDFFWGHMHFPPFPLKGLRSLHKRLQNQLMNGVGGRHSMNTKGFQLSPGQYQGLSPFWPYSTSRSTSTREGRSVSGMTQWSLLPRLLAALDDNRAGELGSWQPHLLLEHQNASQCQWWLDQHSADCLARLAEARGSNGFKVFQRVGKDSSE